MATTRKAAHNGWVLTLVPGTATGPASAALRKVSGGADVAGPAAIAIGLPDTRVS